MDEQLKRVTSKPLNRPHSQTYAQADDHQHGVSIPGRAQQPIPLTEAIVRLRQIDSGRDISIAIAGRRSPSRVKKRLASDRFQIVEKYGSHGVASIKYPPGDRQ
ncbi:hypothetical protein LAD77_01070 [Klebsiella pneumoniae]|nr:hypothetical protein [Klebsiella pneumoniae]